jgi:tRNA threonylcarbamoyladenosine biosynthesis protein TsaE
MFGHDETPRPDCSGKGLSSMSKKGKALCNVPFSDNRETMVTLFHESTLAGLDDTERSAQELSCQLRAWDVVYLTGPLGAGKTTFARGLIRARLGDDALEVISPTYTLIQTYENTLEEIWHCDFYRLSRPDEAAGLGLEDAEGRVMLLIEWPEKLGNWAPAPDWIVSLQSDSGSHHIRIEQVTK